MNSKLLDRGDKMKRILIVEDEAAIRGFEAINLGRAGYQTVEAGSAEEAV